MARSATYRSRPQEKRVSGREQTYPVSQENGNHRAPNVYLGRDGILRIDYRAFKRITIDVVRKAYEGHFQLSPAKRPVLIFGQSVLSMDHEATTFASGEEVCGVTKAAAVLAKSFSEEQLGNMYLAWHTPPFPTRLFTSESAALRWLVPYANE